MSKLRALSTRKFLIILFGSMFFGALAISVYQVYRFNQEKYFPGIIQVNFDDEISYQEAIEIVEAFGLSFPIDRPNNDKYEYFNQEYFQADALAYIGDEQEFETIAEKLKQHPKVVSVEPTNRDIQVKSKMSIRFDVNVTRRQAAKILFEAGLIMDEFTRWDTIQINVPVGKEQYYVDQLGHLPSVSHTTRVGIVRGF